MLKSIATLKHNELFGELTEDELLRIAPLCSEFAAIEDSVIFAEGRQASHLYILKEGKISLQKSLRTPNVKCPRRTTVAFCYPEELLGWSALVAPFKYTLSAVAWESSRFIRIDSKMFRRALDKHPEMGYKIMTSLSAVISRRLRLTTESLTNEREYSYYDVKV